MGCHEKHLTKGEDLISSLHPERALKHHVPGDQIVRPRPRLSTWLSLLDLDLSGSAKRERRTNVGLQRVLEGSCGGFNSLGDVFRHCASHQP